VGNAQYLYGHGRLGEYSGTEWFYYTTDALGSVRQIVDGSGEVVFYQAYAPYGEVLVSAGEGGSNYGYAGEWTDAYIKLIYLRSRYYAPTTGRFLTRDVWQGDYTRPLSLNGWNYVEGNPVRYTDPSGYLAKEDWGDATSIYNELLSVYNVRIKRDWGVILTKSFNSYAEVIFPNPELDPDLLNGDCYQWVNGNWRNVRELELVKEAVVEVTGKLGGLSRFKNAFHNRVVDINRAIEIEGLSGLALPFLDIWLDNSTFYSDSAKGEAFSRIVIAHELGHIWDIREFFKLSSGLGRSVGTIQKACTYSDLGFCIEYEYYSPTSSTEKAPGFFDPTKGETEYDKYAYTNLREDWAESFASYIYPNYWSTYKGGDDIILNGIRWNYVETQIQNIP
jgi:RHS repeat-associated protein